jgi:hypothetical protein
MYKWAGVSQRKSILYGAAVGMALQLTIETLDGFSAEWGFSMGDLAANTIGSGILVGQELLWKEQRILFKFSTHYRYYNEQQLANRANELYGKSIPERALKDYNAQSYWLSGNISSFIKSGNKFPKWLNIAVGYGADNLYGGYENKWSYDINGKPVKNNTTAFITYTRTDLKRYRQFYLSPDIDFSRIKTKSRLLKTLFLALNVIKIPMPTLTYNQLGNTKFHLLYF